MQTHIIHCLGVAILIGAVSGTGCRRQSDPESAEPLGIAERTGAALDRAADRTAEAAKDLTGRAIERTGETMESVGASLERTGAGMQPKPDTTIEE